MANNDSIQKTITVALLLCVVCSIVVSTAAVMLRPAQVANKALDFKRNILSAAGILQEGTSIAEQFEKVNIRIVDLQSGKFSDQRDTQNYDQFKAAKDAKQSRKLSSDIDIAKIGSQEKYSKVYIAVDKQGNDIVILPVRGYGLWGTLYGFLALESDVNTVVGLGFYEHMETPGLGGEVDNPSWKASIVGKKVRDESGNIALNVIKGIVTAATSGKENKIDGLSGATLTSKGVGNLLQFWLGDNGFGPFLANYKNGEA